MADVFISYASEDRERARAIAHALEQRDWSVWWDHEIPVGRSYAEVIERELAKARCVVVLWSTESVRSQWVQNEAREGLRRHVLVPATINDVQPPLEFRHLQTASLQGWEPGDESGGFAGLARAVETFAASDWPAAPPTSPKSAPTIRTGWWTRRRGFVAGIATLVAVLLVLVVAYLKFEPTPSPPIVKTTKTAPQTVTQTEKQTGTQTRTHVSTTSPPLKEFLSGVGELVVAGKPYCTAFLISPTQAVTANECVQRNATMTLRLARVPWSPTVNYRVRPGAASAGRSYALLELERPAESSFEPLELRTRRPRVGEEVQITDSPVAIVRVPIVSVGTDDLLLDGPSGIAFTGTPVIAVSDGSILGIFDGSVRGAGGRRKLRAVLVKAR